MSDAIRKGVVTVAWLLGFLIGDINGDDKINLQESICSLRAVAEIVFPVSGTTIDVPGSDGKTIQEESMRLLTGKP